MANEKIRLLEGWEAATVAALVRHRQQLVQQAQTEIAKVNQAIETFATNWAGDDDGPFAFEQRGDDVVLMRVVEEEKADGS